MTLSAKEREFHRKTAAGSFNRAWDLLDKKDRTEEEDVLMLNTAHASRFHWGFVGSPKNRAVGEWQISRIYAELGQPRLALDYARLCLQTCREEGLSQIEHTADEAMARAYAVGNNPEKARKYLLQARKKLDKLTLDKEDRGVYLGQLKETEGMIIKSRVPKAK